MTGDPMMTGHVMMQRAEMEWRSVIAGVRR